MNLAFVCLVTTLVVYLLVKPVYRQWPYLPFSPAILAPVVIVGLLLAFHVPYSTYMQQSHWIVWMLGPTTIAFAVPIYEYRKIIKQHAFAIGMGIGVGMSVGMLSAFYLARLFHFDRQTTLSLMSRSISTPFAMELTQHIGGSVELVILFTVITGMVGMIFGDLVLAGLKISSHLANGASLGNAAHGFGTSKAYMRHKEEGVIASLTMVLAGIFMVITGPLLVHLIFKLLA